VKFTAVFAQQMHIHFCINMRTEMEVTEILAKVSRLFQTLSHSRGFLSRLHCIRPFSELVVHNSSEDDHGINEMIPQTVQRALLAKRFSKNLQGSYKLFLSVYFVSDTIVCEFRLWSKRFDTGPNPSEQRVYE
jgi:hypothetical protein